MDRRGFLAGSLAGVLALGAEPAEGTSLRGLLVEQGETPALKTREGKLVPVTGDAPTMGVYRDKRLAGADFEVVGQWAPDGRFQANPRHQSALFVHRGGKRLQVTYWCDVCYIRTYTPGDCWCCQEDTRLDLIEREP